MFSVVMPNTGPPTNILNKLNCCVPTIKFTLELPSNGALPFLDVVKSLDNNGTPTFKIFRKPTHVNGYVHWFSAHSSSTKKGILIGQFLRALH